MAKKKKCPMGLYKFCKRQKRISEGYDKPHDEVCDRCIAVAHVKALRKQTELLKKIGEVIAYNAGA